MDDLAAKRNVQWATPRLKHVEKNDGTPLARGLCQWVQ